MALTACARSPLVAATQPAAAPTLTPASPTTQAHATMQALALGSKQSGDLTLSLFSNPNPPIRGNNTFEAVVTDTKGQPMMGRRFPNA